jgi:hypothetical protein
MKPKQDDAEKLPVQPSPGEQSGSTGRPADTSGRGNEKDSGQGRYGQSGLGGHGGDRREPAPSDYPRSSPEDGDRNKQESNPGSGRADRETDGVDQPPQSRHNK